jgi:hypothetical protein
MVKIYDVETWGNVKNQLEFIDGHDLPYLKGKKLFYNPCHK